MEAFVIDHRPPTSSGQRDGAFAGAIGHQDFQNAGPPQVARGAFRHLARAHHQHALPLSDPKISRASATAA